MIHPSRILENIKSKQNQLEIYLQIIILNLLQLEMKF